MSRTTLTDLRAAIEAGQRLIERGTVPAHGSEVQGMARLICEMFDFNPEVSYSQGSDFTLVHDALTDPVITDWTIATLRQARSDAP